MNRNRGVGDRKRTTNRSSDEGDVSVSNNSISASPLIFNKVYGGGSACTKIYELFIVIYIDDGDISDSGQLFTNVYRMRRGGSLFLSIDKLLIYKNPS